MSNLIDSTDSAHGPAAVARPVALTLDIIFVVAISALAFWLEDLAIGQGWIPFATESRGAVSVVAGAGAAVGIVLWRGGTLADLGFKRPARWSMVPLQAGAILVAFVVGQALAPMLVASFIDLPAPDLSRYDSIAGNLGGAIFMALALPLTASIPEEIIYRGFLIGRLSGIFGHGRGGAALSVLVAAVVFGSIHFQWGFGGMVVTFIMGLVWGTAFLLCGRNLWVVIIAHSAGHILLVVQLYLAESIIL